MSVVNKMLQDLEARKAVPEFNADYQEPTSKRAIPWLWLLMILTILVTIWYGYNFYNSRQLQLLPIDNVGQQQPSSSQQAELSNAAQPSALQTNSNNNMDTHLNNNVDTHLSNSVDTHLSNSVDTHFSNNEDTHLSNSVDTHLSNSVDTHLSNNEDTHLSNNEDTHLSNNEDTHPAKVEKSQQSVVNIQTARAVEMPITQRNNASLRVNTRNTSPVKAKSTPTGNEPVQAIEVQKQEPLNEVIAVKTSSEVATDAEISQQIQVALKRGDELSAIELLDKLLTVSPGNLRARKRLAAMQFSQGEHDKANSILQKGIELQPENLEMRLMQARLYVQMKNPNKAHELLANYAITAEQSVEFVSYRAALAQRVARFAEAQKDYFELTQNQPANAKWWLGLAVAEERLGNSNLALSAYQNAKQLAQLSLEVDKFVDQRIQYLAGTK